MVCLMSYGLHLRECFENFVVLDCIFIIYLITFHGFFPTFYNYLFISNINILLIQSFENYNIPIPLPRLFFPCYVYPYNNTNCEVSTPGPPQHTSSLILVFNLMMAV